MKEKVYKILETSDDVDIFDSQTVDWSKFEFTNGYTKHNVTTTEILRFYLVSSAYYGNVDYEDILLLINNITDPFEMAAGSEIKIPKIQDLKTFIYQNRS